MRYIPAHSHMPERAILSFIDFATIDRPMSAFIRPPRRRALSKFQCEKTKQAQSHTARQQRY